MMTKKVKRGTSYHVRVCLASPSTSRTHLCVATVNSNRKNYRLVIILKSKSNILISNYRQSNGVHLTLILCPCYPRSMGKMDTLGGRTLMYIK